MWVDFVKKKNVLYYEIFFFNLGFKIILYTFVIKNPQNKLTNQIFQYLITFCYIFFANFRSFIGLIYICNCFYLMGYELLELHISSIYICLPNIRNSQCNHTVFDTKPSWKSTYSARMSVCILYALIYHSMSRNKVKL